MTTPAAQPPPFLSPAFHLHFFPKVLRDRYRHYRSRDKGGRQHVLFEIPLVIAACIAVGIIGLPSAVKGSIVGLMMVSAGSLGLIALAAGGLISEYRVRASEGYCYTYDHFVPSAFIFFVILGLSAGVVMGALVYASLALGLAGTLAGVCVGYLVGIFAGLWVHALGFMAIWFIYFANAASAFMIVFDFIVLLLMTT